MPGRKSKDRIGLRYGRLVVIDSIHIRGLGTGWKCRCDCGEELYAAGSNLETGNTTSCGCYHRSRIRTHGKTKNRVYTIWKAMCRRCAKESAAEFANYGGRGISVCERWKKFENFLEDMGEPPDGLTIERVDNEGNYDLSNCRWATYKDQLNNRRNSRFLEAFGKRQTMQQWAEEMKMPTTTLKNRIDRAGWPVERALTEPWRQGRRL